MKKFGRKPAVRAFGSGHVRHRMGQENRIVISTSTGIKQDSSIGVVFTGPSVEGTDKEYVKVYSGKVIDKKPSFA
jgi:predicted polyphosphate/ATP-dependent NAD kinase